MHALRFLILLIVTLATGACTAQDRDTDAHAFWSAFRQAVLDNDKAKLAGMTRFPFEVRGPTDGEPVKRLQREGFLKTWDRLVAQKVYLTTQGQIVQRSMRQLIEAHPNITRSEQTSDTMRYEQFEFERVKGRWMFTRAYLDE